MTRGFPATILVADGDPATRTLLNNVLTRGGYTVVEACDSDDALAAVLQGGVDAMLLDPTMPGLSGFDIIHQLRSRPLTRTLPILLVTGAADVTDRVRGLEAGASDYLPKPIAPEELLARVQAQLRVQEAWRYVVDGTLRERASMAETLCQIRPESTPEATADVICEELGRSGSFASVAVLAFVGGVVPLAVHGSVAISGLIPTGPPTQVRARARRGPWVVRLVDADDVIAYAPLTNRGHLLGLLAIRAAESRAAETLAAAIDFAPIAAALLAPALEQRGEREVSRAVLDQVISERAFTPTFQPIFHLASLQVVGFEVLTRFADGFPPDRRFAAAAAIGMGIPLEEATLAASLEASDDLPEGPWLSLNVSPAVILEPGLAGLLAQSSRQIVLELTEHDLIEDYAALRVALEQLGAPVRLSVDDAGSGFASLRHILSLAPDYIKLDRSWVGGIHLDPARQALVVGLGFFAQETGSTLVAEGVETEEELLMLRRLGARLGQGYLLGYPVTAAEASRSFRDRVRAE